MVLWWTFVICLHIAVQSSMITKGENGEPTQVMEALNAVLGAASRHREFVILFKQNDVLFERVEEIRAPWGVAVFEVEMARQNNSMTLAQISSVGHLARKLRQVSWPATVVVVSDDPAFLDTFTKWSFNGKLLVWSTRLLILTRLPLQNLNHIRKSLSMTNSMLLHISQTTSIRVKVYVDMPYSNTMNPMLPVASWTPSRGLHKHYPTPYYPDKFSTFPNGARLSVGRVIRGMDNTLTVDDPDEPGEKKILIFNAENALVEAIAENINFTIKYIAPPDKHWGMLLPDGSWTGMIGMVLSQETDIGLGLFTMTPARYSAVDFTHPVTIVFASTFAGRGSPEVDPWSFLLPFTSLVWGSLLSALLGVVVVMVLLLFSLHLENLTWTRAQAASGSFIRVLLQQDVFEADGWWWWERVMVGVWMLITLVLTKSYAGNLMSQLAVRYVPEPIQTLEDILDTRVTLIIPGGTSEEQAFRTASGGIYKEVWELRGEGRLDLIPVEDMDKNLHIVKQGHTAYIALATESMMKMSRKFTDTGNCDFYIGRGTYLASLESLAVAKGSPLLPAVSRKVMQVAEAGLYWYWYRLYYPNLTSCLNAPTKFAIKSSLAIRNIWGMFVVLAGGGVTSFVVLILELLYPYIIHSHKPTNNL